MSTAGDRLAGKSEIAPTEPTAPEVVGSAAGLSPQNVVEVAAVQRHLRRTQGFSLALVVVNHASTRDEVLAHLVPATAGLEVRLSRGAGGPVPQIEAAVGTGPPTVVFLVGLELLVDGAPSVALDNLNLNRDFLARRLACPLVILGPAWLVGALAGGATDLWSVRSNVFELVGDAEAGGVTVEDATRALTWEAAPAERQAKARLLEDLAEESVESAQQNAPYLAALARARGDAALMLARYEEAGERYGEALAVYRQIGDRLGEANSVMLLGEVAGILARYEEAGDRYGEALVVFRQIGDRRGEANSVMLLGEVARMLARYGEAGERYGEALAVFRQIGDRRGEANTVRSLGDVARMLARYEEAGERYGEALAVFRKVGDRRGEANAVLALGEVALMLARYEEAGERYGEALVVYRQIGDRRGEADSVRSLGEVARMLARYGEAGERYGEALPVFRQIGDRMGEASTLVSWGRLRRMEGARAEARADFDEAARIFDAIGRSDRADVASGEARRLEVEAEGQPGP